MTSAWDTHSCRTGRGVLVLSGVQGPKRGPQGPVPPLRAPNSSYRTLRSSWRTSGAEAAASSWVRALLADVRRTTFAGDSEISDVARS